MLGNHIAAVCAYFNPCRYPSRIRNYRRFREALEVSGIRLLTVELAFGDEPFEVDGDEVLRLRGGDIMWQKERLLQIGAEKLVSEGIEKVVLLDSDILFHAPDWPVRVSHALDEFPVVQCFSAIEMNYADTTLYRLSSVHSWFKQKKLRGQAKGGAWAVRAEIIREVGLYQHCVIGGGDSALCMAALGLAVSPETWEKTFFNLHFIRRSGEAYFNHYFDWAKRFWALTGGQVGLVEGEVSSLPHGSLAGRNYDVRHQLLCGFDPALEVSGEAGGAFSWTAPGERHRESVTRYFHQRDEG